MLRTHVSNNWHITKPPSRSEFYTKEQQDIIHDIFKGIINPEWYAKFLKQLKDDTGGKDWGHDQSIAIFGKPGSDKFEFVMTGRHMTIRADGNTEPTRRLRRPDLLRPCRQRLQRKGRPSRQRLLATRPSWPTRCTRCSIPSSRRRPWWPRWPAESGGRPSAAPSGMFTGIAVSELSRRSAKGALQKVLHALIEPYRKEDQDEALECLKKQGGLDKCYLTFYKEGHMLDKANWDNWRLEGPSFVWYFRGTPHVHVWVNVADDPKVPLNAKG